MSETPNTPYFSRIAYESVRSDSRLRERDAVEKSRSHGLDNTLAETFPCSDPLSSIPNPESYPVQPKAAED